MALFSCRYRVFVQSHSEDELILSVYFTDSYDVGPCAQIVLFKTNSTYSAHKLVPASDFKPSTSDLKYIHSRVDFWCNLLSFPRTNWNA